MSRNIIVFLASVMILVALFVGYAALVRDPTVTESETSNALDTLPPAVTADPAASIDVGAGRIPGGGGVEMTIYDDRTGRATDRLRVADWQPVPGSKNEIQVTKPELSLLLPSGMTATISADEGRLTADRVQRKNVRPKFGTLRGNATIVIDRATDPDRAPAAERPEDIITIRMTTMEFDLELGQLRTAERIEAIAGEFRIAGTGLKLAWNQADNVVDTLLIEKGEELVVTGGSGLFDDLTGTKSPAAPASAASTPPPGDIASQAPPRRPSVGRRSTTYRCVLTGSVTADHYRGDAAVGSITADELRLLFDVGGNAGLGPAARSGPTTRPASQSASTPSVDKGIERLVVRWNGPLSLTPERGAPRSATPRRRIEAIGSPVRLNSVDGSAVCGRLEFSDDTKQIWLQPQPGKQVTFSADNRTNASASSVYVDRRKNIIKLVGDVALESRKSSSDPRPFTLRCSEWAELLLAAPAADAAMSAAPTEALALGRLRSGSFVGNVRVDMGAQTLVASELQTVFASADKADSLEASLKTAVAVGEVRLSGDDQSLRCGRLTLAFAVTDERELYPRQMEAFGAVRIDRGRAVITGERIEADFEPLPRAADQPPSARAEPLRKKHAPQRFALRNLAITGRAELRDPENQIAARGEWIAAVFAGDSQLVRATVSDPGRGRAAVYSRPYTVRGAHIVLDAAAEALSVDGPSRLTFKSTRSLQGEPRAGEMPVVITASRSLRIDARRNTVDFAGDVLARSADETLTADTLTLLLEDVAAPAAAHRPPTWGIWHEIAGRSLALIRGDQPPPVALAAPSASPRRSMRKEPLRLIARNATISSETREPGRAEPIMHMSITAPELNAEIPQRIIRTLGQTTLYMTNRNLGGDGAAEREASGLPSAMLSRGPSQTAMQADGSMTYVIGPNGAQRRDTVLFEGGVFFVHRAGREMVDFEKLFPEIVRDPNRMAQIKSRNTRLQCQRLECEFVSGAPVTTAGAAAPAGGGRSQRLNWLLASGDVYLRDAQGAGIRTVQSARAEFDRTRSTVLVSGTDSIDARVMYENAETRELSEPAVGREFVIDLERNTVQTGAARGEFSRP